MLTYTQFEFIISFFLRKYYKFVSHDFTILLVKYLSEK